MGALSSNKTVAKKAKKLKVVENSVPDPFEPFNIKIKDVEQAVEGVIKFISTNPVNKNKLFNDEAALFLQINSFKIPKVRGPVKKVFRIPLEHSILPNDADVCLIVPDVKGIRNDEHEQHLEHYEKLLKDKNVTGIKKIMTFHEFRTEYDTFELKKRLVDLYDIFLVDGKISGKVVHKCGKIFYEKRKLPVAIKLAASKLQTQIENALKKVFFHMQFNGDCHSVQFGHSQMSVTQLVDNVHSIVSFLSQHFPGKMENIRSLNVYAYRGSSIPIYMSLVNPNDIKVPTLKRKISKVIKTEVGELTTQYKAIVKVKPTGHVIVQRTKRNSQVPSQDNMEVVSKKDIQKKNKHKITSEENSPPNKKSKTLKLHKSKRKRSVKGATSTN